VNHPDIDQVILTEDEIQTTVAHLGKRISDDYADKELLLVGVLRGAFVFMSDLARQIELPLELDFMAVSSYGSSTRSSGVVRFIKDLDTDIEGRHVLIVEDIIDSGLTLKYLMRALRSRDPASLEVCALITKPAKQKVPLDLAYHGFAIEPPFVVGYGLDYRQRYRNLPFVGTLRPEVHEE
jgi:hypoxanthine phosphoribosyltransferase